MSDPLNSVRPGTPMTEAQKKELAEANAKSSADAQKMAADQRALDMQSEPKLLDAVQGSIKEKLKNLPPLEGNQ